MKKILPIFITIVLALVLCGCSGTAAPSEREIKADLMDHITDIYIDDTDTYIDDDLFGGGQYVHFDVTSFAVEKRQTEDRYDTSWCVVELESMYYHATRYIICYYDYYDKGGWMLENWELYQEDEIEVIQWPLIEEKLIEYFDQDGIEVLDTYTDEDGSICLEITASAPGDFANLTSHCIYARGFNGSEWYGEIKSYEETYQWNIVGSWKKVSDQTDAEFTLTVDSFDQSSMTASGTVFYQYGTKGYSGTLEEANIYEENGTLVIDFSDCDGYDGYEYVIFSPVYGVYTGEWHTLSTHSMERVK